MKFWIGSNRSEGDESDGDESDGDESDGEKSDGEIKSDGDRSSQVKTHETACIHQYQS